MVEQVPPQVEHHPLADAGQHQPGRRPEHPGCEPDGDVGEHVDLQSVHVGCADAVVDRVADDLPARDGSGGRDGGEQQHDGQAPPAANGIAPEAGETGARVTRQVPRPRTAP